MVSSIVGHYLMDKGLISMEQFRDLLIEQRKTRVNLGVIAVAEGLMAQDDVDRVTRLQAVMDKHFEDIAVEKGYLTKGQAASLLKKRGNVYLAFAQALEDQQLMTVEQLEQYMLDYRFENQLTASDMEDIKSDNEDRILPLFLPLGSGKYLKIAGIAVRTLRRLVDMELYIGRAAVVNEIAADNAAVQKTEGTPCITCGIAGNGNDLLFAASAFGQEKFSEVNEEAMDAIGELLNCISGLYASAVNQEGISMELLPPESKTGITKVESNEMLVIPIYIRGKCMNFLIAVDGGMEIK